MVGCLMSTHSEPRAGSAFAICLRLIFRWLPGAVDHEHLYRSLAAFQFQSKLFLKSREKGRTRIDGASGGAEFVRSPFEIYIESTAESCAIHHQTARKNQLSREALDRYVSAAQNTRTEP